MKAPSIARRSHEPLFRRFNPSPRLSGNRHWSWRDPAPEPTYDVTIVVGGSTGRSTTDEYLLRVAWRDLKVHAMTKTKRWAAKEDKPMRKHA